MKSTKGIALIAAIGMIISIFLPWVTFNFSGSLNFGSYGSESANINSSINGFTGGFQLYGILQLALSAAAIIFCFRQYKPFPFLPFIVGLISVLLSVTLLNHWIGITGNDNHISINDSDFGSSFKNGVGLYVLLISSIIYTILNFDKSMFDNLGNTNPNQGSMILSTSTHEIIGHGQSDVNTGTNQQQPVNPNPPQQPEINLTSTPNPIGANAIVPTGQPIIPIPQINEIENKKSNKTVIIALVIMTILVGVFGFYKWHNGIVNISKIDSQDVAVNLDSLNNLYNSNENAFNRMYLNKTLVFKGVYSDDGIFSLPIFSVTDNWGNKILKMYGIHSNLTAQDFNSMNIYKEQDVPGFYDKENKQFITSKDATKVSGSSYSPYELLNILYQISTNTGLAPNVFSKNDQQRMLDDLNNNYPEISKKLRDGRIALVITKEDSLLNAAHQIIDRVIIKGTLVEVDKNQAGFLAFAVKDAKIINSERVRDLNNLQAFKIDGISKTPTKPISDSQNIQSQPVTSNQNNTQHPISNNQTHTVIADKAYFYNEASISTKRKGFLVKGQQINYTQTNGDFLYCQYTNDKGTVTSGWLLKSDVQ